MSSGLKVMKTVDFLGHECYTLANQTVKLLVTRSVGPRILSLGLREGENLLALYFPNSHDGLLGVRFVNSVIESSKANGKWTKC